MPRLEDCNDHNHEATSHILNFFLSFFFYWFLIYVYRLIENDILPFSDEYFKPMKNLVFKHSVHI